FAIYYLPGADLPEQQSATNGWKAVSPREEIRPLFEFNKDGGPSGGESLVIRADDREGLDGCWARTFPIKGAEYDRFRALRRLENVRSTRRSALARVLWGYSLGRTVLNVVLGSCSYTTSKPT